MALDIYIAIQVIKNFIQNKKDVSKIFLSSRKREAQFKKKIAKLVEFIFDTLIVFTTL